MVMKYALINGKILNGHQDMEVETGKAIFIENEKIVAIEPYRNLDKSYQIIDLQGKYILPGLINMHVHLAGNENHKRNKRIMKRQLKCCCLIHYHEELRTKSFLILQKLN